MKVLGIAGSPRRGGNTDILLNEILQGAASHGAETKTIILSNVSVSPCKHCDYCLKAGHCKIQDDMQMIYKEVADADVIVIASPIQFMGLTSETKAMVDRFQAMWGRKYVLKVPPLEPVKPRRGIFVSVGGRKGTNIFESAIVNVKALFRVLDINYSGELVFSDIDEKGAIRQHPDAIKQAFLLGQKLTQ